MKTSLLLTCLLILCYGCRKEDHGQTYPIGEYESVADIKNDAVVLYTKDKAITDAGFIQAYLNRNQIYGLFNLAEENIPSPVHVTFDNRVADSTYFSADYDNQTLELIFNKVRYENNTAVFTGRDSLPGTAADDGELSCLNVSSRIRKHPMLIDCIPFAISVPNGVLCKSRQQVPVIVEGDHLTLPVITYTFRINSAGVICRAGEPYAFGQFNADALKTIHTYDTLVVQTRMLTLKRK